MKIISWCVLFILCFALPVHAENQDVEQQYEKWQENFLGELDLEEVQEMIDDALGEDTISVWDTLKAVLKGELPFSKETLQEMLYRLFFLRLEKERNLLSKMILLILLAAIFRIFTEVFENGQVGTICFYMVYLLLFIFLAENFAQMSSELEKELTWISDFMKALAPAYYMTIAAATGITTAAVFYQGVLLLVFLIQWGLKVLILPCINLYVLLMFINHLSKEEMVSKFAELLQSFINWSLKTFLGLVIGLQVVRGLVTPLVDSLKRGILGRTASVIPGIGNVVNTATELILTCAILIRNSLGVVAFVVFLLFSMEPILHYFFMSLAYRFLAAAAQPVSDKRMVACLGTMGEGCMFLLRVFFHAEFLCMVTILILMVSFGGG